MHPAPMDIFWKGRQNVADETARVAPTTHRQNQTADHRAWRLASRRSFATIQRLRHPGCRCKATPPIKHGPYYQISIKRHGKSTTQFVREQDLAEVQTQLDNYRQLRELVDEWITLSSEISSLRIHELREAAAAEKTTRKSRIAKENANRRPESKRR